MRKMKTNNVTPTASIRLIGKMKPQKLVCRSYPAHKIVGARVMVNPPFPELANIIMRTGATGRIKAAMKKRK